MASTEYCLRVVGVQAGPCELVLHLQPVLEAGAGTLREKTCRD
jgi:hypothetical protein